MVDNDKDRMNPRAGGGSRAGDPSQASSSQNMSGSRSTNNPSSQQASPDKAGGNGSKMTEDAKQQAKAMASQATEQGKTAINQQKDTVAHQVDSVSGAMRDAADKLQQDGQSQTGHYVSMFADQLESFGRQLRNKDANTLIRDMENLSRRAPLAFFAGALVTGFVAARFLKSSTERSPHEYGSRYDNRYDASRMHQGEQDDTSYSWRNEMGEGTRDENIGNNRTRPLDTEGGSLMADSAAGGTLGGQWGAGTTVAGPEITGIYRPSQADSTPGTELPGSAQPAVAADDTVQPGRPTSPVGGSTASSTPTEPKSGGNIYGNR